MPEPIEYLILTNLRDALAGIRSDNGFHYDVRGTAVKLDPNQGVEELVANDGARPFILLEVLPERREYMPSLRMKVTRPVTIHWVSESVPDRDADRMQVFFRGIADVERAIVADIQRGGWALDTRIRTCTFDHALDGSQVWAAVEVDIIEQSRVYGSPDVTP